MATRVAVIGLDATQTSWLEALAALAQRGDISIVAAGHRSQAAARELGQTLHAPAFDDMRQLLMQATPQAVVIQRTDNVSCDWLRQALTAGIGIFSLGPLVEDVAEAIALDEILGPRSALYYRWPRFAHAPIYRHMATADEFIRPIRFMRAQWTAPHQRLLAGGLAAERHVWSLSVLAADALITLTDLLGIPDTIYASMRGAVSSGAGFRDFSGSAGVLLRYPQNITVSLNLSDDYHAWQRELVIVGQGGLVELQEHRYAFYNAQMKKMDDGYSRQRTAVHEVTEELRTFLEHLAMRPSPHRGWEHHLPVMAATLEAMLLSQRTGTPEAPASILAVRR